MTMHDLYQPNLGEKYPNSWIIEREANDNVSSCRCTETARCRHNRDVPTRRVCKIETGEGGQVKGASTGIEKNKVVAVKMNLK
jgi:hypothetical protein